MEDFSFEFLSVQLNELDQVNMHNLLSLSLNQESLLRNFEIIVKALKSHNTTFKQLNEEPKAKDLFEIEKNSRELLEKDVESLKAAVTKLQARDIEKDQSIYSIEQSIIEIKEENNSKFSQINENHNNLKERVKNLEDKMATIEISLGSLSISNNENQNPANTSSGVSQISQEDIEKYLTEYAKKDEVTSKIEEKGVELTQRISENFNDIKDNRREIENIKGELMQTNQKLMMKIDIDQYDSLLQQIKAMLSNSEEAKNIDMSNINLEGGSSGALKEMGNKLNMMESEIYNMKHSLENRLNDLEEALNNLKNKFGNNDFLKKSTIEEELSKLGSGPIASEKPDFNRGSTISKDELEMLAKQMQESSSHQDSSKFMDRLIPP